MNKPACVTSSSRRALNWRDSLNRLRVSARTTAVCSALVLGAALASHVDAQTSLYWDVDGDTSTATGGTGAWDTTSLFWRPGAATGTPLQTYTPNSDPSTVTAHFGGTVGTVTIATGVAISVNSLAFDLTGGANAGYTIAGGTGSTLNLSGTTPTIVSNFGTQETITAALTGAAGLTETNATTTGIGSPTTANGYALRLQGDLSGLSGTVNVGNGNTTSGGGYIALGTGVANYTTSQFQTWNIAANGLLTGNNQGTGYTYSLGALSGAGILRNGTTNGAAPAGTDTFQIGALNTSTTFSGTIVDKSGTAQTALTKVGTGNLTLTGFSTATGGTIVNNGTLTLATSGGSGTVQGVVTVNAGATLNLSTNDALGYNAGTSVATINVNGGTVTSSAGNNEGYRTSYNLTGGTVAAGSLFRFNVNAATPPTLSSLSSGATSFFNANIDDFAEGGATANSNLTVSVASGTTPSGLDLQIAGAIQSAGGLIKTGTGVLNLTGQSTFSGPVTVSTGRLNIGSGAANDGSTGALGLSNAGKTITVNANATLSGNTTNWFGNQANTGTFPSIIVNGGTLTSTRYTPIGPITLNGASMTVADTVDTGNYQTYALRGNITVGGTSASTIASNSVGTNYGGIHLGANTTFTVAPTGSATQDLIVNAPLINQSGDYGNAAGGLTKAGGGKMALNGTNTYTGTTTVNAGTLLVNGSTAAGAVTVNNSGSVLGGGGTVAGTIGGATTINAGSITGADIGSVGALTLASTLTITGGTYAVDISGATADKLTIGGTLTLSGANITFNGTPTASSYVLATFTSETGSFSGTAPSGYAYQFNAGGTELDLVAVPEPATWLAGGLLVGLAGLSQRRKVFARS